MASAIKSFKSFWLKKPVGRVPSRQSQTLVSSDNTVLSGLHHRLPKNVVPKHYVLCLKPDFSNSTFEGTTIIKLKIRSTSKSIVFHSNDLKITKVVWQEENNEENSERRKVKDKDISYEPEKEQVRLTFDPPIPQCNGILQINFNGNFSEKNLGMFNGSVNSGMDPSYDLMTQFGYMGARRCFPCWDEPDIRTTFELVLIIPKGKIVLSNSLKCVSYPHPTKGHLELEVVEFNRTANIPCSRLGFFIGSGECFHLPTDDLIGINVFCPYGRWRDCSFTAHTVKSALEFYKGFFGLSFSAKKLDIVALDGIINEDRISSYGLACYPLDEIVIDENENEYKREQAGLKIGELVAHQWFDNLVAMQWWSYSWLSESMACYSTFAWRDNQFPGEGVWNQFITDVLFKALEMDGFRGSLPVQREVNTRVDIQGNVSFKGAALLRMLHSFVTKINIYHIIFILTEYVGNSDFCKGLQKFMSQHEFFHATSDDLWKAMEEVSFKPVLGLMSMWTKQDGFPLIRVSSSHQGRKRVLKLTQEKFWTDPVLREKGLAKDVMWHVPLAFTVSTSTHPSQVAKEILMQSRTESVVFNSLSKHDWVKVNAGGTAFCRVKYSPDHMKQLMKAVHNKTMDVIDRINILDDMFALAQAGVSNVSELLGLVEAYQDDEGLSVWETMSSILDKLIKIFEYASLDGRLKAFGRYIFTHIHEKLGWERTSEEKFHRQLRPLVLNQMSKLGHQQVIEEARQRFKKYTKSSVPIPVELRDAVYTAVLTEADEQVLKSFCYMYKETSCVKEKRRIAKSLGHVPDSLLNSVLDFALHDNLLKPDRVAVLSSAGHRGAGREITWNYLKENWSILVDTFDVEEILQLVRELIADFTSRDKVADVTEFFNHHKVFGSGRALSQSLECIRVNEAWLKREQDDKQMSDFLNSF